ncbi:hypothetical protein HDU83_002114 [Entophlyctis luteolus]|nr:hypothetical protein HDU82_007635 [Entophlyctis luteolus]KAJ3347409.1 hypothetical protein HDU83_002114 [Entophlyctis luteolus]KAJ3383140.1 hypothetical protein HDU84_003801 [Entophlyctis sp. JEL0112]
MPIIISSAVEPDPQITLRKSAQCTLAFEPTPKRVAAVISGSAGTVRVTEAMLEFCDSVSQKTLAIDYPSIVIYAISRGGTSPDDKPCIYCQLESSAVETDASAPGPSEEKESSAALEPAENEDEIGDGIDDGSNAGEFGLEMRIIPEDPSALEGLFEAISACAALHPDKDMMEGDADDDDGEGWIMTADDLEQDLSGARQAALDHLESVFVGGVRKEPEPDPDRFEDACESDGAAKKSKESDAER